MKHYTNAALAGSLWCSAGGKAVAWLCAQGCRGGVGRYSTQRYQGLWAMPVAPSCCASRPGAEWVVHGARTDPAFSRGSDGRKSVNPLWDMGTKICLSATGRGGKKCGKTDAASKSSTFHIGFPCRAQIIGAVWMAKPLLLQAQHSPAVLSGLCGQIVPTQVAEFSSRASRVDCDLLARNAA